MPYQTKKIKDKYRVVEAGTTKIAKNTAGTAIDGGGKTTKSAIDKQTVALNIQYAKKKGHKIPKKGK